MKSLANLFALVSAAVHAADIAETPKKFYETTEWANSHPVIVTAVLFAVAMAAVIYSRRPSPSPAIYEIAPRGRRWVHRAVAGKILGVYTSKKLATAAAVAFHTGRGTAVVYIRDAAGNVLETIPFS